MTTNASAMMSFMTTDYSTSTPTAPAPPSRWRRVAVLLATVVGVAVTARLGWWQLDRAAEKAARQTLLTERANLPPLPAAALARRADEAEAQWQRRIVVTGRWIERATVFLDNRPMSGRVGFHVVTPLQLDDGSAVLVQRGWAPRDAQQRDRLPPVVTPTHAETIEARIVPTPSQLYDLGGEGSGPIRQNLDIATAARTFGLPLRPVVLLQVGADSDGLRRDWPAPSVGIDKHHGYAVQWFALSALIAGLFVWFQLVRPRRQAALHAR
jgi:surfeit locus 1 family protein